MIQCFNEFVERKVRDARKHLHIIKEVLEKNGFKIADETDRHEDPYIFIYAPEGNLSFQGIRVYEIGKSIAWRCQKKADVEPFGQSFKLPVEAIFEDLLGDHRDDNKIAEEVIKAITGDIKDFFDKCFKIEQRKPHAKDALDAVYMRASNSDYSNQVLDIQKR